MRNRLIPVAAILLLLAGRGAATAGWMNELGRNLGLGWSDGYHAYDGCADRSRRSQPWSGRSHRNLSAEEYIAPYLAEPSQPAPTPATPPLENLPAPKKLERPAPIRTSERTGTGRQLHISRPNY